MTPNFNRHWMYRADIVPSSPFGESCMGGSRAAADLTERGLFDLQIPYRTTPAGWYGFGWRQGCVTAETDKMYAERRARQQGALAGCSCEMKTLSGAFKDLGAGTGPLDAVGRIASKDEKRSWLVMIRDMEQQQAAGAEPAMIARVSRNLFNTIVEYDQWEYERSWNPFEDSIPSKVDMVQRLNAMMITAAPPGSFNKAILENAQWVGERGAEEMSPEGRFAREEAAVYAQAAKQSYTDVAAGNPFRAAREQGYVPDVDLFNWKTAALVAGGVALAYGVGGGIVRKLFG